MPCCFDRIAQFLGPHVASFIGGIVCGGSVACSACSAEEKGMCVCVCVSVVSQVQFYRIRNNHR